MQLQCREEISHLVAILNSRVDIELEEQSRRDARGDSEQVGWIHGIPITPAGDLQHVNDIDTLGTFPEKSSVSAPLSIFPTDFMMLPMQSLLVVHHVFS